MRSRSTARTADELEREVVDLVEALRDLGNTELAGKLWRCQQARHEKNVALRAGIRTGWPFMCRSVACPVCRRWLAKGWRARAAAKFVDADNAACSHATVMLACTSDLDEVQQIVRQFRTSLRNLRDRNASRSRRWASVQGYGLIEVDAHHRDDLPLLPPKRREVVQALPHAGRGPVIWVTHCHLSLHHPRLDRQEVGAVLRDQWAGPEGRVDLDAFHAGEADINIANLVSYASKARMTTKLKDFVEEPWPMVWRAAYWSWLCSLRAGLAPLRVQLSAMHSRRSRTSTHQVARMEPMPVVFA